MDVGVEAVTDSGGSIGTLLRMATMHRFIHAPGKKGAQVGVIPNIGAVLGMD